MSRQSPTKSNFTCNGEVPPNIILPNQTPKCPWTAKLDCGKSPHTCVPPREASTNDTILSNILESIGHTPMVRLNKIAKAAGLECELVAKCEFLNSAGSLKDRIGFRMIEDAEKQGLIKPGYTIIEPTSGNTGIALAQACAVKGYKMIIIMSEKMSDEKMYVMKSLGAEVVRSPQGSAFDSAEGSYSLAWKLKNLIPNSHIFDQYRNASNPLAHYDTTAEEILTQCNNKLDMIVIGTGTGGTITGIGRKLKERIPNVEIVGVDPIGSVLARPAELNKKSNAFQVEGIGKDFIPTVLDYSVVDIWDKADDAESFMYARSIIKDEGLLCGGSSGAVIAAAVKYAKKLKKGQRCVVMIADSIRNYLTKFVSDTWMVEKGYLDTDAVVEEADQWWWNQPITVLDYPTPATLSDDLTCNDAIKLFTEKNMQQMPVINKQGDVLGIVSATNMTSKITKGKLKPTDPITKMVYTKYKMVEQDTRLGALSHMLNKNHFAMIVDALPRAGDNRKIAVKGLVTSIDLLGYVIQNGPSSASSNGLTNGTCKQNGHTHNGISSNGSATNGATSNGTM